jgi:hypothetical protein
MKKSILELKKIAQENGFNLSDILTAAQIGQREETTEIAFALATFINMKKSNVEKIDDFDACLRLVGFDEEEIKLQKITTQKLAKQVEIKTYAKSSKKHLKVVK